MKRPWTFAFVAAGALAGWMTAGAAYAQDEGGGTTSNNQRATGQQPTGSMTGQLITASAKVDKVDADKRELTLKSQDGKPFTINVPENISRLDNVKPGEAQPGQEKTTAVGRAPGALPGGGMAQQITTTAKITNVSPSKDEVTIEGPAGKSNTIKVDDPQVQAELGHLKVGDKIQTTYTQAMATSVTPARTM